MTRLSPEPQLGFNGRAPQRELTLAEARACVREQVGGARAAEAVALESALGRVLAEAIVADRDYPAFARALRDGYALRAAGSAPAMRCVGQARPGMPFSAELPPGACIEIMTGAAVPAGADAVVMVERTAGSATGVAFTGPVAAGDHIAPPGSDVRAGTVVVAAGRRLTPAGLAALASVGCVRPRVHRRPRVAVLATGDELVAAAAVPGPYHIRNSNGPMLAAQICRAGGEVIAERVLPDEAAALEAALEELLPQADVVVFCGGASVGARDLVGAALAARGAALAFDAVRIRPGRPVLFGRCGRSVVFGLPGNPLGSLLACELLVRPALDRLAGVKAPPPPFVAAQLGFDYQGKPLPLDAFRPVRMGAELEEVRYNGSADLAAAAAADGFWRVPAGTAALAKGATVQVLPL